MEDGVNNFLFALLTGLLFLIARVDSETQEDQHLMTFVLTSNNSSRLPGGMEDDENGSGFVGGEERTMSSPSVPGSSTVGTDLINSVKTIKSCSASDMEDGKDGKEWIVPDFAVAEEGAGKLSFVLEAAAPWEKLLGSICEERRTREISLSSNYTNGSVVSSEKTSERDTSNVGFRANGYLQIKRDFFNTDEYCVKRAEHNLVVVRYCEPECTAPRPCVPKCFPPGQVMSFLPKREPMSSGPVEFSPKFYVGNQGWDNDDGQKAVIPHFVYTRPKTVLKCDESPLLMLPYSEEVAERVNKARKAITPVLSFKFKVQTDGRLLYQQLDDHNCPELREIPPGTYCIDGIQNVGRLAPFNNTEDETVIFSCAIPTRTTVVSFLFGVVMISSSVFLLLILIVYGLLWQQQNIHGWTIMGHTASMFFTYIFLGLTHIIRIELWYLVGTRLCFVIGVLAHFFFLSTFCWLTLISFDLWWTFRSIAPSKNTPGFRLIAHLLIGWGIPGLIVFVSVCLDLTIGDKCTGIRLPKYGQKTCYITGDSQGLYIYYPVAATLLCNLVFFVITLYKLYHYRKRTSAVSKRDQSNHQMLVIFAKLFFVMGITWVFEFISWLHVGVLVTWFWASIDIINILQAFAIFIIYVCKQDILDSLEKKYPSLGKYVRLMPCSVCLSGRGGGGEDSMAKASSSAASREMDGRDKTTKTSTTPGSP